MDEKKAKLTATLLQEHLKDLTKETPASQYQNPAKTASQLGQQMCNPSVQVQEQNDTALIPDIISFAEKNGNITTHDTELKAFFLWMDTQGLAPHGISNMVREILLAACPTTYPVAWKTYQDAIQDNRITFKRKPWKKRF